MATLKNTRIDDTGALKLPSGTTAQRPISPSAGFTRFNTELNVIETYNGSSWLPAVKEISAPVQTSQTLFEAVGVLPDLYYSSEDLEVYSDGTALTSSNPWRNRGSLNSKYDLINDTTGHYSTNVTKTTQSGSAAANFSSFCGLAFKEIGGFTLTAAGVNPTHTVAYVYGGGTTSNATNDSSPVFAGHTGTPAFPRVDGVEGGLFGWHNSNAFGGSGMHTTWYNNDGWVPLGITSTITENSTPQQWIHRVNNGVGTSWTARTPGPFFGPTNWTGGSIGTGPAYGAAALQITGMSNVRRANASDATTTGYVYEAALWTTALTDQQIQNLRNFFAEKYKNLNAVGR
jgi:hypothetical protein